MTNNQDFATSIGVEYALIPRRYNPQLGLDIYGNSELGDRLNNVVGKIEKRFARSKTWKKLIYNSPSSHNSGGKMELGAIELSSTPCKNSNEVRRFFDYANKLFAYGESVSGFKFVPNTSHKGIYIEGGGLHIHTGLPSGNKLDVLFRWNLQLFVLSNPIIQWCMSEYCDDDTLISTYYNALQHELGCKISKFSTGLLLGHLDYYSSDWGRSPIQLRTMDHNDTKKALPTAEFRCFGATNKFDELMDAIDLVLAIWKYVREFTNNNEGAMPLRFANVSELAKYSEAVNAESAWQELIALLGLNYARYSKYLKNYRLRKKHGILYSKTFAGLE